MSTQACFRVLVISFATLSSVSSFAHEIPSHSAHMGAAVSVSQQEPQRPLPAGHLKIVNHAPFVIIKKIELHPVLCKGEKKSFDVHINAYSADTIRVPPLEVYNCYVPWPSDSWSSTGYTISIEYEWGGRALTEGCVLKNTSYPSGWSGHDKTVTLAGYLGQQPRCTEG